MSGPHYEQAITHALGLLQAGLSANLTYHNVWHTEQEILPTAVRLAQYSRINKLQIQLLRVAAAYHDVGFIQSYHNHEAASIKIARAILPEYSFNPSQINQIIGIIAATRLPQSPQNELEAILADADLDVLGRDDFFARNDCLYREVAAYGEAVPLQKWLADQIVFLSNHQYFTKAAQVSRQAGKEVNLVAVRLKLRQLSGG